MSLFIHNENQKLLWNIIHETDHFKLLLKQGLINPNNWFKVIIEKFYSENKNKVLNKNDLNTLNKNAIYYMIQELKQLTHHSIPDQNHGISQNSSSSLQNMHQTQSYNNSNSIMHYPVETYKSKQDIQNNEFNELQKQYNSMFEKPKPPQNIQLNDTIKDEAISNMEELLRIQMLKREEDIKMILPNDQDKNTLSKIKIENNEENINISHSVLPLDDIKNNKKVSWADDYPSKDYNNLLFKYNELNEKYMKLESDIKTIFQLLQDKIN